MAKKHDANQLQDFRPISLIPQIQKLYSKWLYAMISLIADQSLPPAQHGFRRKRQCAEVHAIVNKLREVGQEWRMPFVILKIDISKAFDKVYRGAIISSLLDVKAHPRAIWALARELVNTTMRPSLFGTTSPEPVPTFRGVKQGSPESGLLCGLTVAKTFRKLTDKWSRQGYGFQLQRGGKRHQYEAFADDTIVLGKNPRETKAIYDDIVQDLQGIGLGVNGDKTQFISKHPPSRCSLLPGKNQTGTGMIILGRHFDIVESTSQDLARKEASAWAHFRRIRQILRHKTGLGHRFRILQSCVLQRILWGCESWVLTKKRLQHLRGIHTKMLRSMIACPGHLQGLEPGTRILEHTRHVRNLLKAHKFILLDELAGRRFWNWCGHVARLGEDHIVHEWIRFRDMVWWRKQQENPQGWRHIHSDAAIARWEGPLIRYSVWKENWKPPAKDRERWKKAFDEFWVRLNTTHHRRSPKPGPIPRPSGLVLQLQDRAPLHLPPPPRRENRLENTARPPGGENRSGHNPARKGLSSGVPRAESRDSWRSQLNVNPNAQPVARAAAREQSHGARGSRTATLAITLQDLRPTKAF